MSDANEAQDHHGRMHGNDDKGVDPSRTENESMTMTSKTTFNEQTRYMAVKQIILVFLACSTVDLVALMDQTTLAVASSAIAVDLRATISASWIYTAYFLTSTSFQLLYGRISDIVGRKQCLLAGLAIFFLGSLGASQAPSIIPLIVFRALTGIGGGGLMTIAQVIVGDVVPLRERGQYQGILGAVVALANSIGPVIGGALSSSSHDGWRNIFRLNLPLSALCAFCIWYMMPLKPVQGHWKVKVKAIDYLGALLTLASSTVFLLGLSWAGSEYSWTSVAVLLPLLLGLFLALLFLLWQWRGARVPLMPLHIFRSPVVCAVCLTMSINGWLFLSQVFYIPQFYQLVFRFSAVKSGALLLPVTLSQTLFSTLSGVLIKLVGRYRECILLGWALWAVGLGLLSTLTPHASLAQSIGYGILTGIGVGLTLQPALIAVQSAVDRAQMAVVTSTRNFVRNLGGSIGLALNATLILNAVRAGLTVQQQDVSQILDDPLSALSSDELSDAQKAQLVQAYARGFRIVFLTMTALAVLSFLVAFFFIPQLAVDRADDQQLKEQAKREMEVEKQKGHASPPPPPSPTPAVSIPARPRL